MAKKEYRGPRRREAELDLCRFTVPRDANGDFILPPMRGWHERRRAIIEDLKRDLAKHEKRCRFRKNPSPAVLDLRRVIREWQDELDAGIPKGNDLYGPLEVEDEEDDRAA